MDNYSIYIYFTHCVTIIRQLMSYLKLFKLYKLFKLFYKQKYNNIIPIHYYKTLFLI